ncbi:glutamine synthetase family protein [Albibacillus kandeliae]|uniref:glutamine synthetase family protein n=1 Tax=Albibacillus kandeliae TaxID=2174228 RepID=UPI001E6279FB|nr:glutamine synthetase family protein [Albibacillus kandeliae]
MNDGAMERMMPGADRHGAAEGHVLAAICDMNGVLRGKRVPRAQEGKLLASGIRMPMSSIGVDIWGSDVVGSGLTLDSGDLDGVCLPTGRDPLPLDGPARGMRLLPMVMGKESGGPYYADCRNMLSLAVERLATRGLRAMVATELEFYLLAPGDRAAAPMAGGAGSPPSGFENIYSLAELAVVEPFLDAVYATAGACGIELDATIAEGGSRQFEINLKHRSDALRVADDTVYLKEIIRRAARRQGIMASFMAKPFEDQAGSGMHVHFSLVDQAGVNVFDDGGPAGTDMLRHAIGGLIESMPDLSLVFAPHLNSYRRLRAGSLAPTQAAWGYENRTAAIRVPGGPSAARRIEHRVAGADANPYLILAAILGAAERGIELAKQPPAPVSGNAYREAAPKLAWDWLSATDRFETSELARLILHPELVETFVACKRQEQEVFAGRISPFEFATYRVSV